MRTFFKSLLAIISGGISFIGIAYLLLMVNPIASFAGIVILPFLFGMGFKTSSQYGLLTYPLLIALPIVVGIGYISYQLQSAVALIFLPTALISVMLASYIRNYADSFFNKHLIQITGGYAAICSIILVTIIPNMYVLDLSEEVDEPLPDTELTTINRETIDIAEVEGNIVVIDFWATWCGKCKQMMPELERLDEKYMDNPEVTVKAVNTSWQDSFRDMESFVSENNLKVEVFYDEEAQFTEAIGVSGVPYTAIIDTENEEIKVRKHGFAPGEDYVGVMSNHIDRLLANR